jgi:hypothetical protein
MEQPPSEGRARGKGVTTFVPGEREKAAEEAGGRRIHQRVVEP